MKTNNSNRKNSCIKENIILGKLATKTINKIAKACGYIQRNTGKISPKNFIVGFMIMVAKHRNTYEDWATEIGLLANETITKQSLCDRMQPQTEALAKSILEKVMSEKLSYPQSKKMNGVLNHFNNVMIDDSTTLHLPDELVKEFPGNVSRGIKKAQAKIHAMYNLTQNNFPFFHLHSFSNNDQSLSANVLPYLQKGDLCIRDLGFTILDVILQFIENHIYFIARKNYTTKVYDIETGTEINLLKELLKKGFIDREVFVGRKQQIKARLIATRIPQKKADERKRKARTDRDKRLNHANEYYRLLDYNIYITNITPQQCDAENIYELYKLRWNIEIIFKSWKSCFALEKIIHRQCKNVIRVHCTIYLMLLYIYLFHVIWWSHCVNHVARMDTCDEDKQSQTNLSVLKLANFFRKHFTQLITIKSNKKLMKQIKTHCSYDKRKDRENATQLQFKLAA